MMTLRIRLPRKQPINGKVIRSNWARVIFHICPLSSAHCLHDNNPRKVVQNKLDRIRNNNKNPQCNCKRVEIPTTRN